MSQSDAVCKYVASDNLKNVRKYMREGVFRKSRLLATTKQELEDLLEEIGKKCIKFTPVN